MATVVVGTFFLYVSMHVDNPFLSQLVFGYFIFILSYVVSLVLTAREAKTKGDVVLNSLPLKRKEIVKGRYITMLLYTLGIGAFIFILGTVMAFFVGISLGGTAPNIFTVLLGCSFVLLFFSVYLPVQYHNIGKVQIFSSIFYMFFILGPYFFSRYAGGLFTTRFFEMLFSLDLVVTSFIVFAFSCFLYFLSYGVSVKIYKRKEF